MWTLKELQKYNNRTLINDNWVPSRPLNYTKKYTSLKDRMKRAWAVFTGKADAFMWPEGQ